MPRLASRSLLEEKEREPQIRERTREKMCGEKGGEK